MKKPPSKSRQVPQLIFLLLLAAFCMYNDLVKTFRPY